VNFLVALTAAVAIAGPSAGPADLAIVGPTEGAPGQVVRLLVAGLPSLDPSATMGDGLKFLETIDVKTSTPTAAAEIQIRKRIGLSLSPLAWEMELEFTPPAPGATGTNRPTGFRSTELKYAGLRGRLHPMILKIRPQARPYHRRNPPQSLSRWRCISTRGIRARSRGVCKRLLRRDRETAERPDSDTVRSRPAAYPRPVFRRLRFRR